MKHDTTALDAAKYRRVELRCNRQPPTWRRRRATCSGSATSWTWRL